MEMARGRKMKRNTADEDIKKRWGPDWAGNILCSLSPTGMNDCFSLPITYA